MSQATTSFDLYLRGPSLSSMGFPPEGGRTYDHIKDLLRSELKGHVIFEADLNIKYSASLFHQLIPESSLKSRHITRIKYYGRNNGPYCDHSGLIITLLTPIQSSPSRVADAIAAVSLADPSRLGLDPTVHMCIPSCKGTHTDLAVGAIAHEAMIKQQVLHGDLSPNNFIIHECIGYFIDFDHMSIIKEGETFTVSFGTGTIPYLSMCILKKMSKNTDILKKSKITIDTKKNHNNTNSFAQLELIEHNASDNLE
ncbi:hypothetical protein DFJ58DRAFT_731904 [Suillus subalutaceus]|uniref:uncharacterized protein n=1 Tax=Suillus subalutaceus TaxID=48586 RepID=UPI001B86EE53|nr:uncharacterized protein DFJ58DRAFT_731904 [Suillus subalutaceus]KAG1842745.1 hypothetical protein DFJ58DRAFT_731904 [Suillus subalutaceus]